MEPVLKQKIRVPGKSTTMLGKWSVTGRDLARTHPGWGLDRQFTEKLLFRQAKLSIYFYCIFENPAFDVLCLRWGC